MLTSNRWIAILVTLAFAHVAIGEEPRKEFRTIVLMAPASEALPVPKEYRFLSRSLLRIDEAGVVTTEKGVELPPRDFAGLVKNIAESDVGREKGPIIIVFELTKPEKTTIEAVGKIVASFKAAIPKDREGFIGVTY